MWMLMTMVWSLWSLSALRWVKALSLSGPRITRLSQTPLAWLLSLKTASKYHSCVQFLLQRLVVPGLCAKHFHRSGYPSQFLPLSSHLDAPLLCPHLQVQSYLQHSLPGWSGHLLLYGHRHWWLLLQLHSHRGGWVSLQPWLLWNLIHLLFVWMVSVLKVWGGGGPGGVCLLLSVITGPKAASIRLSLG